MGILKIIEDRKKQISDLTSIVMKQEENLRLKGKIMIFNTERDASSTKFGFLFKSGLFCTYVYDSHNLKDLLEIECNLSYAQKYRNDVFITGKYDPKEKNFVVSYLKIRNLEASNDRIYHFENI